jgi:predicted dehydrogenase
MRRDATWCRSSKVVKMAETSVRLALCGGGAGAFIAPVHRMAAQMDGRFALVAGLFSRDAGRGRDRAREWGVDPARSYTDIAALIEGEKVRDDGVQAIAIATANDSHCAIATAALEAGLHVLCEKPMTATLAEAHALAARVRRATGRFGLTYTYAGYAMVREGRARVAAGEIGAVRKVMVDYQQGWLAAPTDGENRQAAWRLDPARSGVGGCIADIGVHAFHLAELVSGLRVRRLCADLSSVVPGRILDDDCNILLRFDDDVGGVLSASQVATGEGNGLSLRIYGETGALLWSHREPGLLHRLHGDGREEIIFAGTSAVGAQASHATRLPFGHPEGFIEAFATLYRDFADAIAGDVGIIGESLPGVEEGLRSMLFIDTAIASDRAKTWLDLPGESL